MLTGRYDADTLSGGDGNDRFVYEDIADSKPGAGNHDTIMDMAGIGSAGGDRIDLHQIDADATKGGNQAFSLSDRRPEGRAAPRRRRGGTDSLVQGEVDGKAGVDFEILVQDGATSPATGSPPTSFCSRTAFGARILAAGRLSLRQGNE